MSANHQIKAVIFDMDGVLTDSEPLINAAAVAMFREKGFAVLPEDFIPFVGTGEDRYLGGVAEKHGIALDVPLAKKRTYEIYLELVSDKLHAFPGAVELVRSCRQAGLRIAVASSADRIKIEANLRKIGLPPEQWDAVVSGEEVTNKKPAPDIFLEAGRHLGEEAHSCVVIEDAVNGVHAAKAAGMRCVAVAQTFPAERLREADLIKTQLADVTLADLTGMPQTGGGTIPPAPVNARTGGPPPLPCSESPAWFWPTIGYSLVIAAGFLAVQTVVGLGFGVVAGISAGIAGNLESLNDFVRALETNGLYLALATCLAAPPTVGLCWLFARVREKTSGLHLKDCLGLNEVSVRALVLWCLTLVLFVVASDGVTLLFGKPIVPEFMQEVYRTAGFRPLLWLALIAFAPMSEEFLFRGFMLSGLARSSLGPRGAVALTSLAWASIHLQYDVYGQATIFLSGLILGVARLKTNSILPCLLMHGLMNLIATVEVELAQSGVSLLR